jgi:uncharacterized protein (DUF885 family)
VTDDAAALLDRFWERHVAHDDHTPMWDSQIEQLERWPSSSPEATAEVVDEMRVLRAEMLAVAGDAGELAPSLRTAADAAALVAASRDLEVEQVLPHPTLGLHSFLFWAVNNYPLVTPEHGHRYLDKLARLPGAVEELTDRLTLAAGEGRAPLARHARLAVETLDAHLASDVTADPLMAQAPPSELDETATAAWRDDLVVAIREHVRPALVRLRDTLRDTSVPAGRDDEHAGLLHLPGGEEAYARLIEGFTTEGMTAHEVHETGLAQVERLAGEYRELGGAVFGTDDLDAIFDRLRSEHYSTSEEVVAAATAMHARAVEQAPAWFLRTPGSPCEVRATEHGSIAFYSRPAADGSRPGVFFFNTSDPTVWGANLASTVFHEGIPGHHFQAALAMEDDGLHQMHRDLYLPAFGEGWALYTERLADEIGLYTSDRERLGMLIGDSMRACRLVVDTGMHALGWSRERAIRYMLDNSPMGEVEVTAEIDRYIGWPGQATSYMIGRLEIARLRRETADRLGERFDLRAFHDVVLSHGMVSLPALRTMVEAWDG